MTKKAFSLLLLLQVGFALNWITLRAISKESDKINAHDIATKENPEISSKQLILENKVFEPLFSTSPDQPRILAMGDKIRVFHLPVGKNGRGLAFDGTDLYYSLRDNVHKGKIFKITTNGDTLKTLGPEPWNRIIGALAWDPNTNHLWAATIDTNTAEFFEIDTAGTGSIVSSFTQPASGQNDPKPTKIDGLAFDPITEHLWYSTDEGYEVFEVTKTGVVVSSFTAPGNRALSGTTFDGINLWHGGCNLVGPDTICNEIFETDLAGDLKTNFIVEGGALGYWVEDLAFDSITFGDTCVVWSNEARLRGTARIIAWEVPCTNKPPVCDANGPYSAECTGDCSVGGTRITLDGTGSSDPDNDPLTYQWSAPGVTFDDPTSPTPTGCFPLGTTEVTLVVSDWELSDTCQTQVTITDTIPPVITCPADTTLYLNTSCEVTYEGPPDTLVTDNCELDTIFSNPSLPKTFTDPDTITITWTAKDASGNIDNCVQTVTVLDTIPPVITCLLDTTLYLNLDCEVTYDTVATATDNCEVDTIFSVPSLPKTFTDPDTITITWTAKDASGNTDNCVQTVTVLDTIPPVITCPLDVTLEADQNCKATYSGPSAIADDNCDTNVSITPIPPFDVYGLGDHTITWIAKDTSGYADTCFQTITVVDIFPPPCCADSSVGGDDDWDVEAVYWGTSAPYNAITLMVDTFPYISFYNDNPIDGDGLWFATKDSCPTPSSPGRWTEISPLDTTAGRGFWTSIAVSTITGVPMVWISYADSLLWDLWKMDFSFCDTIPRTQTLIDPVGDVGSFGTDIAVAPYDSVICIVYYDATNGALKYAEREINATTWSNIIVDSVGNVGQYPAIAVDTTNGTRHVSYYDSTNGRLKYARCNPIIGGGCGVPPGSGSGWIYYGAVPDPDSLDDVGRWTEIDVDGSDRPHISYVNVTDQSVKHAVLVDFFTLYWRIHVVQDTFTNLVASTSIGVGAGDTLHVSYSDRTNQYLMYATAAPPFWDVWTHLRIPDPWGDVGIWNSIAVGAGNVTQFSYSAADATCNWKALKYAIKQ
jgi:hypothetical protein